MPKMDYNSPDLLRRDTRIRNRKEAAKAAESREYGETHPHNPRRPRKTVTEPPADHVTRLQKLLTEKPKGQTKNREGFLYRLSGVEKGLAREVGCTEQEVVKVLRFMVSQGDAERIVVNGKTVGIALTEVDGAVDKMNAAHEKS